MKFTIHLLLSYICASFGFKDFPSMHSIKTLLPLLKVIDFRMTFWCLNFSKKTTQKFEGFLPKNLKNGQIKKIKALYYVK